MIKNNLLGQILIGLLVVFLLISSIQMFGWGQGLADIEIDKDNQLGLPSIPSGIKSEGGGSQNNSKQLVSNITTRPIFSDSRSPYVPEIDEEDPNVVDDNIEITMLKAQLTGVVITPEHSYAMILDNITNERETYKVGMPLDGEQGGWTLTEIHSRRVVFESDDDKSEELELAVFSDSFKAGGSNKKAPAKKATKQALSRKDKKKNADDIRKKIAERRAQMRAEAAKKK